MQFYSNKYVFTASIAAALRRLSLGHISEKVKPLLRGLFFKIPFFGAKSKQYHITKSQKAR